MYTLKLSDYCRADTDERPEGPPGWRPGWNLGLPEKSALKKVRMPEKRVVVIDDCRLTLAIARDILAAAGYEVITTETGIEANRYIFQPPPPGLILIDVEMPLLNGDRKVMMLKSNPASRDIPVVLMSQKSRSELEELCHTAGADEYIVKPLDGPTLLELVARLCK